MRMGDLVRLAGRAVSAHRLRSALSMAGIAVGITAVVLLTSIGEGIHRYVLAEFTQFGTNLVAVMPGKTTTFGMSGAVISNVRPLSLADAEALARAEHVIAAVPVVQGNAAVQAGARSRRTAVLGVGPDALQVWSMDLAIGRFLPADDLSAARPFAVLGAKLHTELFGHDNPLGARIRVGGDRYRVVGVMAPKGQMLGFDLDDAVYIPAGRALELFNRESLMEIDVLYQPDIPAERIQANLRRLMLARHGQEDFTIITQQQMLETLDSVLGVLTLAVGVLGGISLLVGAVGVLTIMTIAVAERTAEIGLLRALGAERRAVLRLFLGEALVLSGGGGLVGIAVGIGLVQALALGLPALPVNLAWPYIAAAAALGFLIGLVAGLLPALRAARMDPVEALRAE